MIKAALMCGLGFFVAIRLAGGLEVFENGCRQIALKEPRNKAISFAFGVTLALFSEGTMVRALSQVTPGEINQLDTAIGQRVEATAVIGTQSVATRAGLGWTLNDASGAIFKIPWEFELTDPRPLCPNGETNLLWAPVFEGGIGYGTFANDFNNSQLEGNESDFSTFALGLGGGPRLYFWDSGFSVVPAFGFIYAFTQNHFYAHNATGQEVVDNGQYVNWHVNTISLLPSFELRFKKTYGRWTPKYTSTFAYFNTRPITRSTDALNFRSSSEVWANVLDLDYLTKFKPLDFPMRVGGDFCRTDLLGGLSGALDTEHYYQADARMRFDILGRIYKVKYVGLTGGYFWSDVFHGYSIGLEGSLQF